MLLTNSNRVLLILKRSFLLFFAGIFLATAIISVLPDRASAADSVTYATDTNKDNKAKALYYYYAVKACGTYVNNFIGWKYEIKGSDIDNGPVKWGDNVDVYIGNYLDSFGDQNGKTHCYGENGDSNPDDSWFYDALQVFGFNVGEGTDYASLLEKLGYNCSVDGSTRKCVMKNIEDNMADYVVKNSPYFNGVTPSSDIDAMDYVVARTLLSTRCSLVPNGSQNLVQYSDVNASTGAITNVSAGSNNSKGRYMVPSEASAINKDGSGWVYSAPLRDGYSNLSCSYLAQQTKDKAQAYARWLGKISFCNNITSINSSSTLLDACADGWAHKTDYTYCPKTYSHSSTTPTNGIDTSPEKRNACFLGQGQNVTADNKPVGSVCMDRYPDDSAKMAACIEGSQNRDAGESFCYSKYPTPDNLNMNGTTPDTNASKREACVFGITVDSAQTNYGTEFTDTGWDGAGATTNEEADLVDCGGGVLNYIICPAIELLYNATETLDGYITSALNVDTANMFERQSQQGESYYTAWNSFRILAVGLLVIVGLFMVVSQAVGIQILDAYTIKKVLPRLMIAIVGISLSWPIMEFVINFFNTVGVDIRNLLYQPFSNLNSSVNFGTGVLTTVGTAATFVAMGPAALTYLITALLAAFIGFVVLILRQIAIVALVIIAPIAIVAYILPNTQKAWKLWSSNFFALMLMFPLIAAMIAAGHIVAAIALQNDDVVNQLIGLIAYFGPYFLIPMVAKMSGGMIGSAAGMINNLSRGAYKGLGAYRAQKGAEQREKLGRPILAKRSDWASTLQKQASMQKYGSVGRAAFRGLARGVGGYNVEAAYSAKNASVAKEIQDQIASGDDTEIRALTANIKKGPRINDNGQRVYDTAAGKEVSEAAVKRAYSRWGHDTFAQQAALTYEMGKASSETEVQSVARAFPSLAKDAWGQSKSRAASTWIGSSFGNQNLHLEYKGMKMTDNGMMLDDKGRDSFVNELYERRGSYNVAQMTSNTIKEISDTYKADTALLSSINQVPVEQQTQEQKAVLKKTRERMDKVRAVAETFMHEAGRDPSMVSYVGEDGSTPQYGERTGGVGRQAGTPGPAHTAERVKELADLTGVSSGPPPVQQK